MKLFKKLYRLLKSLGARIMFHYRSRRVAHRKEDFYDAFAVGGAGKLSMPPDEADGPKRTSRWISFVVLLAIVVATGALFYRVMATFFLPLFLSLLLTVMFRPLYLWMTNRMGGYKEIAAGLTTLVVLTIVLAPLAWAATIAVKEGVQLVTTLDISDVEQRLEGARATFGLDLKAMQELSQVSDILTELLDPETAATVEMQHAKLNDARAHLQELRSQAKEQVLTRIEGTLATLETNLQPVPDSLVPDSKLQDALIYVEQLKQSMAGGPFNAWLTEIANPSEEQLRLWRVQAITYARQNFVSATGATTEFVVKLVVGLIIMVVSLYFFLSDGPALLDLLMTLSPLDEVYERELLVEFDRVSRAVVVATILSALVQALLAGIGFWAVGLNAVFLLIMLTFILAMVPFVGAAAVWLPASAYLWFYEDRFGAALFVFLYGALIVSLSDNVIKPLVLHGQSKIHPLLALLSILGGVQALGPVGIFVGPMVVAFLQTLLNLVHREMVTLDGGSRQRIKAEKEGGDVDTSQA